MLHFAHQLRFYRFLAKPLRKVNINNQRQIHSFQVRNSCHRFSSSAEVSPESSNVLSRFRSKVNSGQLVFDSHQEKAAKRLSMLQHALLQYNPDEPPDDMTRGNDETEKTTNPIAGTLAKLQESTITNATQRDGPQQDEGITLTQPRADSENKVGTGKSMLMDLFFDTMPLKRKRRVHFHSFMLDVHARIHRLKRDDLEKHGRNFHVDTQLHRNPIYRVARQISSEVKLLCFDEFQVTDVADALILSQLFTVLFREGTVVVATSNRPPMDLYENGINRSYFLPFLDLLERHCIVHDMSNTTDYRVLMAEGVQDFFFTNDSTGNGSQYRDEMFKLLLGDSGSTPTELSVAFNRSLKLREAANDVGVCRVHFDDLCKKNLGASDYRALAQAFPIIFLEGIPKLTLKEHDQARRFITLVDELYEARCVLLCFADAPPESLFEQAQRDEGAAGEISGPEITELQPGETFGIDVAQATGKTVGELASVIELSFAFRRAASRITEMCSRDFWERGSRDHARIIIDFLSKVGDN